MSNVSSTLSKKEATRTWEEKGEELTDYLKDLSKGLGPIIKIILFSATVYINFWFGSALAEGAIVFPVMVASLDFAMIYFLSRADTVGGVWGFICNLWSCVLLCMSIICGVSYGLYIDAKAKSVSNPVYLTELRNQLEKADNSAKGSDEWMAETIAVSSAADLRERYLNELKNQTKPLDYNPLHAVFHVIPLFKQDPDFWQAAFRIMMTICVTISAFLISAIGCGVGRKARLEEKYANEDQSPDPEGNETEIERPQLSVVS